MTNKRAVRTTTTFWAIAFSVNFLIISTLNLLIPNIAYAQDKSDARIIERTSVDQPANQISVTTDKEKYNPGEMVNITILNEGTQPLHFSGANSDVKITRLGTGETFVPSVILPTSLIPSGSLKTLMWNQQDFRGEQVEAGNYTVQVSVGSLSSNTTFSVVS